MRTRLYKLGDAFSQFLNVLIYNADSNYSISGDAYRFNRYRLRAAIDAVLGVEHCKEAYLNDVRKAKALLEEYTGASYDIVVS